MLSETKSIKTIRITGKTYEKLVSLGKYSDSMDTIVSSIIEKVEAKTNA